MPSSPRDPILVAVDALRDVGYTDEQIGILFLRWRAHPATASAEIERALASTTGALLPMLVADLACTRSRAGGNQADQVLLDAARRHDRPATRRR